MSLSAPRGHPVPQASRQTEAGAHLPSGSPVRMNPGSIRHFTAGIKTISTGHEIVTRAGAENDNVSAPGLLQGGGGPGP